MESQLIEKILLGNPLYMGIAIVALWYFRKQDAAKLDEVKTTFTQCITDVTISMKTLNDTFADLGTKTALHAKDLEHGDMRFQKLEDDNREIRNHLHEIKNDMVTKEHLMMLIEKDK